MFFVFRWLSTLLLSIALGIFVVSCSQGSFFRAINSTYFFSKEFTAADLENPDNNILFVIDNSTSMLDEISQLSNSLSQLVDTLAAQNTKYKTSFVTLNNIWESRLLNEEKLLFSSSVFNWSSGEELSTVQDYLSNVSASSREIEPLIGLSGLAMNKMFDSSKNTGRLDNLHIVILSDEDNVSRYNEVELELKEPYGLDYSYRYRYKDASNLVSIYTDKHCVINGNPHNYDVSKAYTNQVWCSDSTGKEGFVNAKYLTRNYSLTHPNNVWGSCDRPKRYLCEVETDNTIQIQEFGSYQADSNCVPVDPNDIVRVFVKHKNMSKDPNHTNCEMNITCEKQAYRAWRQVNNVGGTLTPQYDGCEAGYNEVDGHSIRIYRAETSLPVQNPLPSGVTQGVNEWTHEDYVSTEYKKFPEVEQILRDTYPDYGEIEVTGGPKRPASPDEIHGAFFADPDGFEGFVNRYYQALRITYNAIVNLNGLACAGGQNNNSRGTAYLTLKDRTGGIQGNICNPTQAFDIFLQNLGTLVVKNDLPSFPLPGIVNENEGKLEVILKANGKKFVEGTDYDLVNAKFIRFREDVLEPNDTVIVNFVPHSAVQEKGETNED